MQHASLELSQLLSQRLSPAHLEMLRRGSGISDEVIDARGYRTITDRADLDALGFSATQCRVPDGTCPQRVVKY